MIDAGTGIETVAEVLERVAFVVVAAVAAAAAVVVVGLLLSKLVHPNIVLILLYSQ